MQIKYPGKIFLKLYNTPSEEPLCISDNIYSIEVSEEKLVKTAYNQPKHRHQDYPRENKVNTMYKLEVDIHLYGNKPPAPSYKIVIYGEQRGDKLSMTNLRKRFSNLKFREKDTIIDLSHFDRRGLLFGHKIPGIKDYYSTSRGSKFF